MTISSERYNAIVKARDFLRDLMDPKKTPRIPKAIRQRAYNCLRHYPWEIHLEELAEQVPYILQNPDSYDFKKDCMPPRKKKS